VKLARRELLRSAAGAAALTTVSRFAFADTYPLRPVHLLVGFAAAGPADIAARMMPTRWRSGLASLHCRKPAGRRQQPRDRDGGQCNAGRLHAASDRIAECGERHALR